MFEFVLNGQPVSVRDLPPQTTLLDFVRSRGLTGAKEGCAEGECGACAVLLGSSAVNSCLVPLPAVAGCEVNTVESLARNGELTAVQRAMIEQGGSQCGYCTPGFIVSMSAGEGLGGNLCRCTGYRPIRDADCQPRGVPAARDERSRVFYSNAQGRFSRPCSLTECLDLAASDPEARYVAGNTDLGVYTNLRFERYTHLISLEGIPELRNFRDDATTVEIGAALTLAEIAHLWTGAPPVFEEWLELFASPLIRNRATLGGNLATASPIGDAAPLLLALDAEVRTTSRVIPLASFFRGYRVTALAPGEILLSVIIPKPLPDRIAFYKVSKRRLDDISTVAACFAIGAHGERFAFGGVAPVPVCATSRDEVHRLLQPIGDHRGSADYRRAVAFSLLDKFDVDAAHRSSLVRPPKKQDWTHVLQHESARAHVTGEALYTDDLAAQYPNLLHAWPVLAPHAHALLTRLDVEPALSQPGVVTTLTAGDAPGEADSGANRHDEPLFPIEITYHSQPVAWVLAETQEAARKGAARVIAEYRPLAPILSIEEAIAAESFHAGPHSIRHGDVSALALSPHRLNGELHIGGQEHFYLETQCAIAKMDESGGIAVESSTQHPSETQEIVCRVLGIPSNQVAVGCLRMGGAFGGKEVQANPWAAIAALGAWKTKRPVRVRLTRAQDMALTGKRHPFLARYQAGFDDAGRLTGVALSLYSDGGWSLDLSEPVLWRALFHCDNAYRVPALDASGWVCKTHKTSQTAFRGFGGPQGMLVIEDILDRIARTLGIAPEVVRERNFYREGDHTHYGQPVKDAGRIALIWERLKATSEWAVRRREIDQFNSTHAHSKRGLAITPVKFGISFTATWFNQAGALVLVYRDGSVQVNHGGTEMGQGLHTKIQEIAARSLGVDLANIRIMPTRTDKVPNTSATAASASTDLNGAAVFDACAQIQARLVPVAAKLLECGEGEVRFESSRAVAGNRSVPFREVTESGYRNRVPLFAHGYYRTPEIHFDPRTAQGKPFHYFAYGAAVSEVEIDGFTGMHRILRADLLEDVGDSVAPLIDRGQIEGGFVQGLGWLTIEELLWDSQGRLATNSASTYKLPSFSELPDVFNVDFLERATEPGVIFGSKAVGEPPLMLAISAREAIRDAIAAFGSGGVVLLDSPATPERIFWAIQTARQKATPPVARAVEVR